MALDVIFEDPTCAVGRDGSSVVTAWYGPPTVAQLRAVQAATVDVVARTSGGRAALLSVVVSGSPDFKQEVRDELVRILRDERLANLSTAHAILLGGLAGVATRAFVNTALLLARSAGPTKVFGSVDEAARWLAPRVPGATKSPADVVALYEALAARRGKGAKGQRDKG